MQMKADEPDYDEWNEEAGQAPGSPNSDHNSLSSGDTARAAPDSSPGGDDGGQRRPKRCKISREQLNILIKSFDDEPLPNFDQRQALAKVLGMTPRSVQIWFQNRRQRLKPMQPKTSGACDMPSSSQLPFRRTPSQGQISQQSFGMPGLAAVAGLCNGYSSDLMSKAMAQLPMGQGSSAGGLNSFVHSMNGLPYDVMEPFAATKALLGAGYQPPASLSLVSRLQQQTAGCANLCGSSASSSAAHRGVSPSGAGMGPGGSAWEQQHATTTGPSNAASASQQKAPQADGLLLLLACAGDNGAPSQPAVVASEAPVYDRSAVAA